MQTSKELPLRWRVFSLPKRGHKTEEYEDAFAADPKAGRFAVADGASESSFAGLWAKLLVGGFVDRLKGAAGESWLEVAPKQWAAEVDGRELAWYGEEKRQQGAFAAFLGFVINPESEEGCRWKALACGDSCLFQVRDNKLIKAFPLARSQDFGNLPNLLGSRPLERKVLLQQLKQDRGKWKPGDCFFLMSDALAQWFLQKIEAGKKPWAQVAHALSDEVPEGARQLWIEKMRDHDGLRNDDVTVVLVEVEGASKPAD